MPATTPKLLVDGCGDLLLMAIVVSTAMPTMAIPCQRPCQRQVDPPTAGSVALVRHQRSSELVLRLATTLAQSSHQPATSSPESRSHTSSTPTHQAYSAPTYMHPFQPHAFVPLQCPVHYSSGPFSSTTQPHLRCRPRTRGGGRTRRGAAGEGAQGWPGDVLAGPDRQEPRRVFLRQRGVSGPVRRRGRRHQRPDRRGHPG